MSERIIQAPLSIEQRDSRNPIQLNNSVNLVPGVKNAAICDTNTGNVYSVNDTTVEVALGETESPKSKEIYKPPHDAFPTQVPTSEDDKLEQQREVPVLGKTLTIELGVSPNNEIQFPNVVMSKENKEKFGRNGRILRVNLSNREFSETDISEKDFQQFLGGKALGMKLLTMGNTLNADPFGEDNELIFATGPSTGYLPGGGASVVITKSPLTKTLTDPVCQGTFGYALKSSGFDAIVFEGKAEEPVYTLISDRERRIISAKELVGLSTSQTSAELKNRHRGLKNLAVATIGPAGENQVRFASIIAETRAFGRGGTGAVMGSKNLKAVVVGGESLPRPYDPEGLKFKTKEIVEAAKGDHQYKIYQLFGTIGIFDHHKEIGSLSRENYRFQEEELSEGISTSTLLEHSIKKAGICFKCVLNCSRESKVTEGPYKGIHSYGPEFETSWALGPHVSNNSPELLLYAEHLCDEYGLDTLSTGGTIAFFLECLDKGLINYETQGIIQLIHQIAYRQEIGDILAEGSKIAAEKIHPEASSFAVQIKGLETPAYDPRGFYGIALAFAISKRGGCHRKAFCSPETNGTIPGLKTEGKAKIVIDQEEKSAWMDSLVLCKWASASLPSQFYSDSLLAITGHIFTPDDLTKIGERAINIAQVFNLHQGYGRKDDILPKRFLGEARNSRDNPINKETLEEMKTEYYKLKGWDNEGRPLSETLLKLDLEDLRPLLL